MGDISVIGTGPIVLSNKSPCFHCVTRYFLSYLKSDLDLLYFAENRSWTALSYYINCTFWWASPYDDIFELRNIINTIGYLLNSNKKSNYIYIYESPHFQSQIQSVPVLSSLNSSLISFSYFIFSSAPYRIFLLFLPWLPCHFYFVVIW